MTTQEFKAKWESGKKVTSSRYADEPTRNFSSYPEEVTDEHESGEFVGVHFSWVDVKEFHQEYTVCIFDLDTVGDIDARKGSHGQHTYLVKMSGCEMFPVKEVENGNEYRQIGGLCSFRKI